MIGSSPDSSMTFAGGPLRSQVWLVIEWEVTVALNDAPSDSHPTGVADACQPDMGKKDLGLWEDQSN